MRLPWFCCLAYSLQIQGIISFPLDTQNRTYQSALPWKLGSHPLVPWQSGHRHPRSTAPFCAKGQYLDGYDEDNNIKPDAECRSCPDNTYNGDELNQSIKCSRCRPPCDTGQGEEEAEPCTRVSNRRCACMPGYKADRPEPELICIPDHDYTPLCKSGERLSDQGVCEPCPHGTTSFGNTSNCFPNSTVPTVPREKETNHLITAGIVIGTVILFCGVIVALIVCWKKWKRRRAADNHEQLALQNNLQANSSNEAAGDASQSCEQTPQSSTEHEGINKEATVVGGNGVAPSNLLTDHTDLKQGEREALLPTEGVTVPEDRAQPTSTNTVAQIGTSSMAVSSLGELQPPIQILVQQMNLYQYPQSHVKVNTVINQQNIQFNYERSKSEYDGLRQSNHVFFRKYDALMANISIDHVLLAKLVTMKVITWIQNEEITKQTNTQSDKVALLLGIVSKRGPDVLVLFLVALCDTHQNVAAEEIVQGLKESTEEKQHEDFVKVRQALLKLADSKGRNQVIEYMERAAE